MIGQDSFVDLSSGSSSSLSTKGASIRSRPSLRELHAARCSGGLSQDEANRCSAPDFEGVPRPTLSFIKEMDLINTRRLGAAGQPSRKPPKVDEETDKPALNRKPPKFPKKPKPDQDAK